MFLPIPFLPFSLGCTMAGEGDGGGGDGGDQKGASGELEQAKADLANAQKEVESLKTGKVDLERKLGDADRELLSQDYLDFLDAKEKGGGKGKGKEDEGDKGKGAPNLEEMSKKELVDFIQKGSKGDLDKAQGALADKIEKLQEKLGVAFARVDISMARLENPDFKFEDNKERFFNKAKENPSWDAKRVLKEVKRDMKEESDAKRKEDEKKAEEERKAITERASLPLDSGKRHDMSEEEAGEAAYRQAFGNKE